MSLSLSYLLKSIVAVCLATMLFSCGNRLEEVMQLNNASELPVGEARNFVLKYTDSTKLRAMVSGEVYRDFGNQPFPYQEFPNGVHVDFFDQQQQKSTVDADYGIIYSQTKLIDLRGNVVLQTHDGKRLEAPQMYWDQQHDWIFTEGKFKFISPEYDMQGEGIDFNREYTQLKFRGESGSAVLSED